MGERRGRHGAGSGEAHVSSTFIGPQIGGRWIQPSGFFTAVDLAWGFPLSFSSEATEGASGKRSSSSRTRRSTCSTAFRSSA